MGIKARKTREKLSAGSLEIMNVVWDKGEVSINEVMDAVNSRRKNPLKRNAIQVQMNRLEEYGWSTHRKEGRTFQYSAAAEERKTRKAILKDIRDRVFNGSRSELVRCLLEDGEVSRDEISSLRKMLDELD